MKITTRNQKSKTEKIRKALINEGLIVTEIKYDIRTIDLNKYHKIEMNFSIENSINSYNILKAIHETLKIRYIDLKISNISYYNTLGLSVTIDYKEVEE